MRAICGCDKERPIGVPGSQHTVSDSDFGFERGKQAPRPGGHGGGQASGWPTCSSGVNLGHTDAMSYTIRNARLADHQDLDDVFRRASLSNENDRDSLLQHPEWLALPERGIREGRMRLAIDEENVIVGFATFLISDGGAELEDLFVDPEHRRRRIAELLVLDISGRVREMGFETLEVTANPHAMAFYEHMGFVACGLVETEFYAAPRMRRNTAIP
jgi:GNAT superfamily N-acetyltransferase